MKKKYQNIGKIVLIIIMGIGLLYAFWNLLSNRFLLGENKKEVEMALPIYTLSLDRKS